ncbi:collagen-like protein [Streptomyces sp. NPDC059015]|uniref:collagen-like triple helix repeat-containing protein n=1 Tax=unclassified Streptomyces TaxID=2593676 RepID=UPI0036D17CED
MALPAGLSTVTVSGSFKTPSGAARKGKLLFTPEPAVLTSATHDTLVLGTTEAVLDADGAFSVTLLATDDADVSPTGWTYRVTERWHDAPGRSYPLSLPAAAPAVDLADVAPTAPAEGEYIVVTGPAGPTGATGATGPQGPAGPTGPQGEPGSEAEAQAYTDQAITTHSAAADPHGDRAWADGKFATIVVVNTLTGTVTTLSGDVNQLDTFVQDCLTRVAAIEGGIAFLAGVNSSDDVNVNGGNLTVTDFAKGYRFRVDGSALDLEATGTDLIVSNWSGSGFNGTQRPYLRLSADAQNVQIAGKVEYVDNLYGATRHVLNGAANTAGFFGATPVSQQTVTGSRSDGSALASLLSALDALGLIDDQTTA